MTTAFEAQMQIVRVLTHWQNITINNMLMGIPNGVLRHNIPDLPLEDFIYVYNKMKTEDKKLFLPEELDADHYVLVYKPHKGCIITLESETVKPYRDEMKHIKFKPYQLS